MELDPLVAAAGLFVGFVVGLTGMGGGALMTPILVLFFGIQPLAAVSSDLVASFVMKPVGGVVHARRGTVHVGLVKWLVLGSVPSAFAGVLVLRALGDGQVVQDRIKLALGVALLFAASSMVAKAVLQIRRQAADRARGVFAAGEPAEIRVRPVPTLLIGVLGGLVVGMTSVGSGSLIIVALLMLYPSLRASSLVGTDLVQAVPLVGSAALGHLLFGDFQFGLTTSLLVGALPGVYLGAKVSASAPGGVVRRALVVVLLASGLKLLGAGNGLLGLVLVGLLVGGPLVWALVRNTRGFGTRPHRVEGRSVAALLAAAASGRPQRRPAGAAGSPAGPGGAAPTADTAPEPAAAPAPRAEPGPAELSVTRD